jgi:hypothetical protein
MSLKSGGGGKSLLEQRTKQMRTKEMVFPNKVL